MANELTVTTSLSYSKSNDTVNRSKSSQITVSGSVRASGVQVIGTSEETLQIGDVTSVGVVFIQNLDPTNYVEVAAVPSERFSIKIKAGEGYPFRATGNTIYLRANTAAVKVAYEVFSE
jgi:hypothetical protein